MDRRDFLKFAGAASLGVCLSGCGSALKLERAYTNFVIIFTDDQGYADVGCYGAKGFSTPNLDAMAKDGVLPPFFAQLHPRYGTPSRFLLLQALFYSVVTYSFDFIEILVVSTWAFTTTGSPISCAFSRASWGLAARA